MKKRAPKKKVSRAAAPQRKQWPKGNAISKDDLVSLVKGRKVERIVVEQTQSNDYWLNVIEKDDKRNKYLATRRMPNSPRMFKHIDVITRFLRTQIGMEGTWVLILNTKVNG